MSLLDDSVTQALIAARITGKKNSYVADNPVESKAVIGYLKGGTRPPTVQTAMGKHLVYLEDAIKDGYAPPSEPAVDEITYTPTSPLVGEAVTFRVKNPQTGVTYTWDRNLDEAPDGFGPSYTFSYSGEGVKTMNLYADGKLSATTTLTILPVVLPPPTTPPPSTGVARSTGAAKLTPHYYNSNDGPEANYQVVWMAGNGMYSVDRTVHDTFSGMLLYKPKSPWPSRPAAGNWGRVWNFHNTPGDNAESYGWNKPPGNSALAFDFYDGTFWLNLDANGANGAKDFALYQGMPLDRRYCIVTDIVWGRTDGGTARKGSVKVWIDGKLVLDNPSCNTMWRWANGQVQRQMVVWAGHYTQDIKDGVTLNFEMAFPWMGIDRKSAMASANPAPGAWAVSDIPISGQNHTLGPATYQTITSWTTGDLVLPAGWLN